MVRRVDRDSRIAVHREQQVGLDQRQVGRLDRDVAAAADGQAEVRLGQRRGVVDAVTDHRDRPAGGL